MALLKSTEKNKRPEEQEEIYKKYDLLVEIEMIFFIFFLKFFLSLLKSIGSLLNNQHQLLHHFMAFHVNIFFFFC